MRHPYGVQDIFIACMHGLKGFPDTIEAVYPKTAMQLCLVHMVRHSLNYVSWKLGKEIAADLKTVYAAATVDEAATNEVEQRIQNRDGLGRDFEWLAAFMRQEREQAEAICAKRTYRNAFWSH